MTTEFSFSAIILALILFSLLKRVCLWVLKFGQWRKKSTIDSISFPQLHKGFTEYGKLCLNLCSFKWLKPILRRDRGFSPNGLFMLKTFLEFDLIKFNKCFLKMSKEAELRISRSRLFHSFITDGKKEFLKKLCVTLKGVMLSEFLVVCNLLLLGNKSNKYGSGLLLIIL